MGNLSSLIKRLSCNCASDCHLNAEIKELHKFVKGLAEEDLREIRDYFLEREVILNQKKNELRNELRESIKRKSMII
tara:strand:- start:512 stop:742 length:231 start_codon:yes stop_codon:yes gene_type:complete